jgi:hypothetical protein
MNECPFCGLKWPVIPGTSNPHPAAECNLAGYGFDPYVWSRRPAGVVTHSNSSTGVDPKPPFGEAELEQAIRFIRANNLELK